jgi:hypothetical protein
VGRVLTMTRRPTRRRERRDHERGRRADGRSVPGARHPDSARGDPGGSCAASHEVLIWDNAPSHMPHRVRDAARDAGITLAFLPFRSPELMPLKELWRRLKATVAAGRCYASLEELAERALAWLDRMSDAERRRCGLTSSKFTWLPT